MRGATDETAGIVADPAYERPADLSLVPSSGHRFKATLEKTLYHAYVAKIGKAVRDDSKYFKRIK